MSMSEFEGQLNTWEDDLPPLPLFGHEVPADFSEEDMAFVQELDAIFAVPEEELPPYFVQTLLEAEEPRFQPVEPGFEHKTRARVFRRLKLRRHLFHVERPRLLAIPRTMPGRRLLVTSAALMLFMILTVMFTAPSFASGMDLLLHGARSGVMLVHSYPKGVRASHVAAKINRGAPDALPTLSLQDAIRQLHGWNLYWPKTIPDNYTLTDTYFYQEPDQSWADGPFMELDYTLSGKTVRGTGQLAIREFKLKPNVSVLQVVKDGAAQAIKVDANGQAQAIFVDGQWVMRNKNTPVWVYGQRSELIYQKDGIVFWIVGDQRDGIGQNELFKIANSLQPFHVNRVMRMGNENGGNSVTMLTGDINGPFTGDVLAIYPDGSDVDPYLTLVGNGQPQSSSQSSSSTVSSSTIPTGGTHSR